MYFMLKISVKHLSFLSHVMPFVLFNEDRTKPSVMDKVMHRYRDRFIGQTSGSHRFRFMQQKEDGRCRKFEVENSNLA